jgi:hypothetical protein
MIFWFSYLSRKILTKCCQDRVLSEIPFFITLLKYGAFSFFVVYKQFHSAYSQYAFNFALQILSICTYSFIPRLIYIQTVP